MRPSVQSPTLDILPLPPDGKTGWPWTEGNLEWPQTTPEGHPWPLISIVTPSFNQGRFIEETIRSVLLQGCPNLEFIIIDGGSKDETVPIIKKYEPWLSYWVSEPDEGQAHAINKGFERTKGDIFAWLNSDDQYLKSALHSAARVFLERPDVDLLYGDCEMIDARGRCIDYIKGRKGDLTDLLAQDFIPQPSAFFRRRAWERVGGLDVSLHFILDFDLWIRMILIGIEPLYIPVPLALFRWHEVSKSKKDVVNFGFEYLGILDNLFESAHGPGLRRAKLKAYHHAFNMIASGCERLIKGGKEQTHDALKALEMWKDHLNRNQDDYVKAPEIWSESLYRLGQGYCLHGRMREGRSNFAAAIHVDRRAYKAMLGWMVAGLGFKIYREFTSTWRALFSVTSALNHRLLSNRKEEDFINSAYGER